MRRNKLNIRIILLSIALSLTIGIITWIYSTPRIKVVVYKHISSQINKRFNFKLKDRFELKDLREAIEYAQKQPWVNEQITKDLAPFHAGLTDQQIKSWFDLLTYKYSHSELCHVSVHAGNVHTELHPHNPYRVAYETILEVIKILAINRLIPDCKFILNLADGFFAISPDIHTPIPVFTFAKHQGIPIEKDTILVPDWQNLRFADQHKGSIIFASKMFPWPTKDNRIHWRGGAIDSMQHRRQLVELGTKFDFLDVGFVHDRGWIDPELSLQYKYQVVLDGNRCTWSRIVWQMQSNCLIIKPNSPQMQWFYQGLQPNVHYLAIDKIDPKTIQSTFNWIEDNESQVQTIINNANAFAENNLKTQDQIAYYALLLREYAKLFEK